MSKLLSSTITACLLLVAVAAPGESQPGRRSQLATVTQLVGPARIEVIYRRPVARGRELFGTLVPFGSRWTPSADSAVIFSTTADLDVAGSRLGAGRYGIWMIPDRDSWTVMFTSAVPVFHLTFPSQRDEVLRIKVTPKTGDHMESLGFYFPMVDGDSAVLNMHWGKTVVPISIKARSG